VLGHFKLLLILTCGIFLFGEDTNPLRLLGMALAFGGIVAYTTLKQSLANEWAPTSSSATTSSSSSGAGDKVQQERQQAEEEQVPLKLDEEGADPLERAGIALQAIMK
jgi:hypothetical protein